MRSKFPPEIFGNCTQNSECIFRAHIKTLTIMLYYQARIDIESREDLLKFIGLSYEHNKAILNVFKIQLFNCFLNFITSAMKFVNCFDQFAKISLR